MIEWNHCASLTLSILSSPLNASLVSFAGCSKRFGERSCQAKENAKGEIKGERRKEWWGPKQRRDAQSYWMSNFKSTNLGFTFVGAGLEVTEFVFKTLLSKFLSVFFYTICFSKNFSHDNRWWLNQIPFLKSLWLPSNKRRESRGLGLDDTGSIC